MKIVVVSGGFDPIHSGHLAMLREAAGMGNRLIVGVNSDAWLTRKKGKPFMNIRERKAILESIRWVDEVWEFDDSDGSACDLLEQVRNHYRQILPILSNFEIWFANGGDRNETNNAEAGVPGINFAYGVGGSDKRNSSSWILRNWNESSGSNSNNWV
jgi:D-beta-D-heptose 7-phosphate kinase/D-beta-D-heptose 1-phosphate adenosyltransferase